eukprot:gene11056-12314_t
MSKIRMPTGQTKVYKDECVYSFDSPYSETGLYLNLLTMQGVGENYLQLDVQRTHCKLYLLQKWKKVPIVTLSQEVEEPTKLAIGTTGGFTVDPQYDIEKQHFLVIYENGIHLIPLPSSELPEYLSNILQACIEHEGMTTNLAKETWDADDSKIVSKYADQLIQLNPENKRISQDAKTWKDEASGATENLWLNLSTGYIGGGRKNWDGTGGSGSALQHYLDTGRHFPLVVKLGTITPHGADVWSYAEDENCMVIDPKLPEHLSFWGIDIMKLEKTEKTVNELEVALNLTYDWSRIMEGQEKLELVSGPGLIGFRNIGSSCYLNSALQCLLAIPEFQERYYKTHDGIVSTVRGDPTEDLPLQLSKLALGILSDRYVPPIGGRSLDNTVQESVDLSIPDACVIAPRMFKHLVGRGHPEFSSGRQQDVAEFLTFLLDQVSRSERTQLPRLTNEPHAKPTTSIFEYHVETKFKNLEDKREVKFTKRGPQTLFNMLELPIPLTKGEKMEIADDPDVKRPRIEGVEPNPDENLRVPFEACLESWLSPEVVYMRHPQQNKEVAFLQTQRFATFPRYLIVKLNRYYVGENWVQRKIVAEVPMPERLDITSLKGHGLESGEVLLEDTPQSAVSLGAAVEEFVIDEGLVAQLVSMGFSENGCRRAAIATKNADVETAMNWVLEHMEDPDFNSPPSITSPTSGAENASNAAVNVNPEALAMLTSMGYTEEQCTAALLATNQDIERAADWLFSRAEDLDIAVAEVLGQQVVGGEGKMDVAETSSVDEKDDPNSANGKYTLFAIISHIGKNTDHGHYVCHIRKEGQWVLFNDDKVGRTEKPPLSHGFVYFYRRDD